ncbi:hypothetical protein LTR66_002228 [Elasticomyces elasticus]|nr:hypothetical protein LTR66_002228 [Elasticomyces elasticus]KAK5009692.1 hypothetical protein LTR28_013903 [Elasticomyces elasticus]
MHDPFPFPAPHFLQRAIAPLADRLGSATLPLHVHEVIFAFALYSAVGRVISPRLSAYLCPQTYPHLNKRTKINWDVHVVSLAQSIIICTMALWVIFFDQERADANWRGRLWGYTGAGGLVQAFAMGYFLWDLIMCAVHIDIFGWGMLAHAISAVTVFSLGFRPFVNYYGPIFLLYELSSPTLNFHWFLDKLNMTGSAAQLVNGVALMVTFFSCRLVWGAWNSYLVFGDMWQAISHGNVNTHSIIPELGSSGNVAFDGGDTMFQSEMMRFAGKKEVPIWLMLAYFGANLVLNVLNYYWFGKMIETIRKRFDPPFGTKGIGMTKEKAEIPLGDMVVESDVRVGRGVYANGRKSVEIEKREVRSRRNR